MTAFGNLKQELSLSLVGKVLEPFSGSLRKRDSDDINGQNGFAGFLRHIGNGRSQLRGSSGFYFFAQYYLCAVAEPIFDQLQRQLKTKRSLFNFKNLNL